MLRRFDGADSGQPVAINPARVTKVVPDKNDPGLSVVFFASNDYVLVRGSLDEVIAVLGASHGPLPPVRE